VLNKGSARNSATEFALPLLAKGPVQLSFAIQLMHKDVKLATQLGVESASPMPISNVVREIYQMGVNEHGGATDVNMLVHTFERMAGISMVQRGDK
jgi:3-hydroxyisobutyrate dehydrogenase